MKKVDLEPQGASLAGRKVDLGGAGLRLAAEGASSELSGIDSSGGATAMKLLLFSDLHCNADAARRLVDRSRDVDVVVGAGDFAVMREGIEKTIEVLRAIERPAVLVPGNGESRSELAAACRGWASAHVLHGSGVRIGGVDFWGLGGGVPVTPFGSWSYDFTEEEAAEMLAGCPEGGVLVTHSPPKGAVDASSRGESLGSVAVRRTVEAKRPAVVVCGHIHDSWEQTAKIGATTVINAGPAGTVWDEPSLRFAPET